MRKTYGIQGINQTKTNKKEKKINLRKKALSKILRNRQSKQLILIILREIKKK